MFQNKHHSHNPHAMHDAMPNDRKDVRCCCTFQEMTVLPQQETEKQTGKKPDRQTDRKIVLPTSRLNPTDFCTISLGRNKTFSLTSDLAISEVNKKCPVRADVNKKSSSTTTLFIPNYQSIEHGFKARTSAMPQIDICYIKFC